MILESICCVNYCKAKLVYQNNLFNKNGLTQWESGIFLETINISIENRAMVAVRLNAFGTPFTKNLQKSWLKNHNQVACLTSKASKEPWRRFFKRKNLSGGF
jgi:hypothetical protein